MENKYKGKKAEEILADEVLVGEIQKADQSADALMDEEYVLANSLLKTLGEKEVRLSPSQKELLGRRISKTITASKRLKLILRIGTAAVFLLLAGITTLFTLNREPEISVFARSNQPAVLDGNTRLILSGEEEIQIKSNESEIAYGGNGMEIRVDSNRVSQSVDGDKTIYNTVIVPYGKRTHITLSDNSSVWLNSGSKLVYPARFASDKREVYLEGEAIFEVSHNKEHPFHVVAHDVEIKVLGTVFDLSAYNDDKATSTVLESGSVEMKYNTNSILGAAKVTMVPGTMAVYNPGNKEMNQSKVNVRLYTSWRDGYIACDKQSLGEILKKISRYYNVSIRLNDPSLENETFTGNLDLRNSAAQVLAIIAEFINIKVENKDNQILITRI